MDQENIFADVPTEKLFKPINIYLGTFFGGPLVAGYLIASNYQALNEKRNAEKTWIFTILGTLLIIFLAYVISYRSTRHIPGYLLPLIYSIITYNVVNIVQKKKIADYLSAGGTFFPTSRVIIVTIVGMVVSVLGLLLIENVIDFVNFNNG